MFNLNSEVYFGSLTQAAKDLSAAENRGGPIPAKFDFSVQEVCAACKQNITPPKKILRCAACKAVIYCSKECSARDWKYPQGPNQSTHKQLCSDNKRHMEKLPQTQAIIKAFPWGRLESDGSFSFDVARGRFGVLGASGYGYWSHRGGPNPHSEKGVAGLGNSPYAAELLKMFKSFDYLDGKELLGKRHLSDEEGWKLPPKFIPYRNFEESSTTRPMLVTRFEGGVVDWDTWYKWRKLSKESPAALLMDYPLSVYQLIVNCLNLTSPKAGRPNDRVPLHLHLIGVEVELNYLPLFSELALLLPYHDIKLVLFGAAVARLVKEATKSPGSLATKLPTFTYQAPSECGSGTISIYLHSTSDNWSAAGPESALTAHGGRPDALVACNAGLASYQEWFHVVQAAHIHRIPFATTEYAEQSAEHQRAVIPSMLSGAGAQPRKMEEYEIRLNPFQKPGQRPIPMYRLPNVVNGFTLVVYKDEDSVGKREKNMTDEAVEVEKKLGEISLD
ncbi:hypothetical protein CPB84DRAFT_1684728 [Gymnopilus junonius]|uniref:MYND-type domain-containing protein n=1 Tax=Gymnopilus junonius TaxID=109634 RepID=A0A9P5TJ70_GYMJU|nr:hypothetical protein CPB84DRAFT_1684728 [Gymnopilus junonius]